MDFSPRVTPRKVNGIVPEPAVAISPATTRSPHPSASVEDPLADLGTQQREIYDALQAGERLTNADIRKRWDISDSTVTRRLGPLKKLALVRFEGNSRTGVWVAAISSPGSEPESVA
jgi:predicted HTH transcriptional regulator